MAFYSKDIELLDSASSSGSYVDVSKGLYSIYANGTFDGASITFTFKRANGEEYIVSNNGSSALAQSIAGTGLGIAIRENGQIKANIESAGGSTSINCVLAHDKITTHFVDTNF